MALHAANLAFNALGVRYFGDVLVATHAVPLAVHAVLECIDGNAQVTHFAIRAFPGKILLAVATQALGIGQLGVRWLGTGTAAPG
jgi:hypothetical protein